jgi:hypothetical protein
LRVVADKLLCLFSGVGVNRSAIRGGEIPPGMRHGAPAAWLDAKGTYLICPMLRRRYLASLSFSRYKRQKYTKRKGEEHFAFISLS